MVSMIELRERLEFLGVTDAHRAALQKFLPVIEASLPDLIKDFYALLKGNTETARRFSSDAVIERAASAQLKHWLMLFSGRYDQAYLESAERIGLIHSRIGLEPRWYMGAYTFFARHATILATGALIGRWTKASTRRELDILLSAMAQAVALDMEIGVSVYLAENKKSSDLRVDGVANTFEGSVGRLVGLLASGATELEATAQSMTGMADRANTQATTVAASAEEASISVQTVASAAEELSASVSEIGRQVAQSATVSAKAVTDAQRTDQIVRALAEGAERIPLTIADADAGAGTIALVIQSVGKSTQEHRSGSRRRRRQRVRGRRVRSEKFGESDRQGNGGYRQSDQPDPVGDQGCGRSDPGYCGYDRRTECHWNKHRLRCRTTKRGDRRDCPQRASDRAVRATRDHAHCRCQPCRG